MPSAMACRTDSDPLFCNLRRFNVTRCNRGRWRAKCNTATSETFRLSDRSKSCKVVLWSKASTKQMTSLSCKLVLDKPNFFKDELLLLDCKNAGANRDKSNRWRCIFKSSVCRLGVWTIISLRASNPCWAQELLLKSNDCKVACPCKAVTKSAIHVSINWQSAMPKLVSVLLRCKPRQSNSICRPHRRVPLKHKSTRLVVCSNPCDNPRAVTWSNSWKDSRKYCNTLFLECKSRPTGRNWTSGRSRDEKVVVLVVCSIKIWTRLDCSK